VAILEQPPAEMVRMAATAAEARRWPEGVLDGIPEQ
jgi:hypothetical protein